MILLALSKSWRRYHSSSPFYNLMVTPYPGIRVMEIETGQDYYDARMLSPYSTALVCDENTFNEFPDYSFGPRFIITNDLHAIDRTTLTKTEKSIEWADYALSCYPFSKQKDGKFFYLHEKYRKNLIFFPHHVDPAPVKSPASRGGICLTGSVSENTYPLRYMASRCPFVTHLEKNRVTKRQYLELLSTFKASVTCNSTNTYTVAKYFEIMWAGCLIVAPLPESELENLLLGFSHENGLWLSQQEARDIDSFTQLMADVLLRWDDYQPIAQRGLELVRRRHTALSRLKYLSILVDAMVRGSFRPSDQYDLFLESSVGSC